MTEIDGSLEDLREFSVPPESDVIIQCEGREISNGSEHSGNHGMNFVYTPAFELAYQYEPTLAFMKNEECSRTVLSRDDEIALVIPVVETFVHTGRSLIDEDAIFELHSLMLKLFCFRFLFDPVKIEVVGEHLTMSRTQV